MFRSIFPPEYDQKYSSLVYQPRIVTDLTRLGKDSSEREIAVAFRSRLDDFADHCEILYTNGSKFDGGGGVGASIYWPRGGSAVRHKLPSETSVFSAEAWAIIQAVDLRIVDRHKDTVICSDSLSVLEAVRGTGNKRIRNYLVHRLRGKLHEEEERGRTVVLFWTPAHRGIPGNERADQEAKSAARNGHKPKFQIPCSDFYEEINEGCKRWKEEHLRREGLTKGKRYTELYLRHRGKPWFVGKGLKREEVTLLNRIRSDHYNLNFSLYRKNLVNSPSCDCGAARQDINHIVFYCPNTVPKASRL